MTWRDRLFVDATNLLVAGPVTDDFVRRLVDRFPRWVAEPAGAPFRFRLADGRWVPVEGRELEESARAATLLLPDGLGLEEIERAVARLGHRDLAVVLAVSGPRFAFGVSHGLSDGTVAIAALQSFLSEEHPPQQRVSRAPTLRALARTGGLRPSALVGARVRLHAAARIAEAAPTPTGPIEPRIASTVLPARAVAELRGPAGAGERPSSTAALAALAFRAARTTLRSDADMPIRMMVGLRRYLGEGWTTGGNFAIAPVVGTLRERDWTPADYRDRIQPRIGDPALVAEYAYEGLAIARARLRARARGAALPALGNGPAAFVFNILAGGVGVRPEDSADGVTAYPSPLMVGRHGRVGPHLAVSATGREFAFTMLDDTGLFDIAAFPAAIDQARRELLVAAAQPTR